MSDPRDPIDRTNEADDRFEAELRSWYRKRPTRAAPASLRAFAADIGTRARTAEPVRRHSIAWRRAPGSRLAAAATAVVAVVLVSGLLVLSGQRGPAIPTGSPAISPPASRQPSPSAATAPPSPSVTPSIGPSSPSPVDDGGTFGGSGLWATSGSTLYLSTDRGATWVERTLPPTVALDAMDGDVLSSVFVLDAMHIWAASPGPGSTVPYDGQGPQFDHLHIVVSRSTDGGLTWRSVDVPGDWGGTQPVLSFSDEQDGVLLLAGLRSGPAGTVFATADGGAAWQRMGSADGVGSILGTSGALWAGNEGDAGPVARPILDVSRDGGRTWADARLPGLIGDVYVNDILVAPPVFSGQDGAVAAIAGSTDDPPDVRFYRTADGGHTWKLAARQPLPENGSQGVAVVDPSHFVVIDSGTGRLAATADGGVTWQQSESTGLGAAIRLMFWDPRDGAAIEQVSNGSAPAAELLRTTDGGQTWMPINLPAASPPPAPPASPPSPSATAQAEVPACDPHNLTAVAGREGEAGVVRISIGFTNQGASPCSLPGVPAKVTLVRSNGKALALQSEPSLGDPASRVVLRPGVVNNAWLTAYWMNWCGKDPGALDVRVTFTAGGDSVETSLAGPLVARCDAPNAPSSIQIDSITGG